MSQDVSMGISSMSLGGSTKDVTMQTASQSFKTRARPPRRASRSLSKGQDSAGSPSHSFQAPTGLTDSDDDSDSNGASFSIKAPTGYSDSDEDEVTSRPTVAVAKPLRTPSPAQQAMHDLNLKLQQRLLVSAKTKVLEFGRGLSKIDADEQREFEKIRAVMKQKQAQQAGQEAARQAVIQERQKELVSGLQQEHNEQAAAMDRQAKAAAQQAEEQRQAVLRQQKEKEERRRLEKEAKLVAEETERKREQERLQAAEKAKAKQEEASRRQAARLEGEKARSARVAPEAAAFEEQCSKALKEAQAATKALSANPEHKKGMREVFRAVNKIVAQIGGTQQQVNTKTDQILALLRSLKGDMKTYALLQLSQGFTDLSEGVESRFPVAEVATNVCNAYPEAVPLLLGRLHQACPLSVPKCITRLSSEPEDEYLKRWRYQRVEKLNKETKKMEEQWEDKDVFLQRVTAHVQFLAAFIQSDGQQHHGVTHAWSYLARMLNALPANRYTAFALMAFIEIAGYKLYKTYKQQFVKLLMYVEEHVVNHIIQRGMEDARSAVRRLNQYLVGQEFLNQPTGRRLEMYDTSSHTDRA